MQSICLSYSASFSSLKCSSLHSRLKRFEWKKSSTVVWNEALHSTKEVYRALQPLSSMILTYRFCRSRTEADDKWKGTERNGKLFFYWEFVSRSSALSELAFCLTHSSDAKFTEERSRMCLEKHIRGRAQAFCIFWGTRRRPESWRRRHL